MKAIYLQVRLLSEVSYRADRSATEVVFPDTSAFVGTNPENAANFCIGCRSRGISATVRGKLLRTRLEGSYAVAGRENSNPASPFMCFQNCIQSRRKFSDWVGKVQGTNGLLSRSPNRIRR